MCCVKGMCIYLWFCVWCKDDFDCFGGKKCFLYFSDDWSLCVSFLVILVLFFIFFMCVKFLIMLEEYGYDENCFIDDDCLSFYVCRDGKCVYF